MNPLTPTAQAQMGQPQTAQWGPQDQLTAFRAFLQASHEQNQTQLALEHMRGHTMGQLSMAPPSRHLGMSGEDITGKTGPYDSGGIDWLKGHNDGSGGLVQVSPQNHAFSMNQQGLAQNAWAGANDPALQPTGAEHMLPSTVALATPGPAMPQGGMYSPQWPAHVQAVQQQLANTQGAIARTKGMFPSW